MYKAVYALYQVDCFGTKAGCFNNMNMYFNNAAFRHYEFAYYWANEAIYYT